MNTFRPFGILLALAAAAAVADVCPVPQVRLPLAAAAPVLDGTVDTAEWAGAARLEGMGRGPLLAPLDVAFWVGADATHLYLAMISATPPGGKLLANVAPLPDDRDARTWLDDSIELVLDPLPDAPPGQRRLYHANINARGAINDTVYIVGGSAEAWRGRWRTASRVIGDRWHVELALPLADLGFATAPAGRTLGVRIGRNWCQTPLAGQTEWSPLGGAYLTPETIPQVTWDAAAPVVQVLQLSDADKPGAHIKLTVANPGATPLAVRVAIACRPRNSAPYDVAKALELQPGETAPVELSGPALNEEVATAIRVTSPDGKTVYYLREFTWQSSRPATVWTVDQAATRKIQTQFAYYPSFNKVRFTANFSALEERAQVTGARLDLRRKGAADPVAGTDIPPATNFAFRTLWDVPPLPEGEYEAVFTLRGVAVDPIVQPFVRHVFPWENNTLGKADVLVEPFTAMEVKGRTVAAILRRHTLGTLGLWDQVESLGRELLSGPMRLEVKSQGSEFGVQGSGFRVVEQRPTRVVTESRWSSGGLKGSTRGEWDYDGMQKWILTLEPSAVPVEALTLIIPLNDTRMPLFHACTDGLRFNYAGATPKGEGRVWDSTKAPRNSIVGSYVPYLWLGAEERGLAVFGENDRGWVTATNVPCQELVRHGNGLELRLHLIAKPTTIDAPRRILIGFQATPTKPMPANWRQWAVSYATRVPPGGRRIAFMGSCWYWGSLTPCLDVYPRDGDLSIWEEFKKTRETGVVNQPFIESWLKGYTVTTPEQATTFKNHVNAGFHTLQGKPTDVLLYTNARGVRFDTREGRTFLDEWHRDAFSTRDWPLGGGVAYDLNPGASFRDYALWYYHKMMTSFADHIYWDDIFLQSDFDLVGTEAYELLDGTVQPAAGLFDMRELIRRTAVMQHELGRKRRANQPHITNTAIAPILSFAGSHLTWEDRVGDTDFQDRYSRDYIRAESIGRQFGNVPFALQLIHGPDTNKNAWVVRTMAGVALVHEIRSIGVLPGAEANLKTLYDYGYGQPDVSVMNYWEEDLPVTLSRPDAVQLIVTKPGSALVLVCDYGNGGDVLLKPELKRLGIAGGLTATNVETGLPLDVTAEGHVRLGLKKHDFALVRIEGKP